MHVHRVAAVAIAMAVAIAACGAEQPAGGALPPAAPASTSSTTTSAAPTTSVPDGSPLDAVVVSIDEGVRFYPACGDEQLEHDGVRWYQVQRSDYPDVYDRVVQAPREDAPEGIAVHGVARVVAPGPGDDVGTLVVWSDGVAYFESDSGDLHAWLVDEELTYNWTC